MQEDGQIVLAGELAHQHNAFAVERHSPRPEFHCATIDECLSVKTVGLANGKQTARSIPWASMWPRRSPTVAA
jgi:hypothetical protein